MAAAPYTERPLDPGSLSIAFSRYAVLLIFKTILVASVHHLLIMHFCGPSLQAGFDLAFQDNVHLGRMGKGLGLPPQERCQVAVQKPVALLPGAAKPRVGGRDSSRG